MQMPPLRRVKLVWRARRVLAICARDTVSPVKDRGALIQLVAFVPFVYVLFRITGEWSEVIDQVVQRWAGTLALFATIPVFIVFNLFRAIPKALAEERAEGRWHGPVYVFSERRLVHTARLSPRDGEKVETFRIRSVPPRAFVRFTVEFDPPHPYWMASLAIPHMPFIGYTGVRPRVDGGIGLSGKGEVALMSRPLRTDATSTIVRVYLNSWSLGMEPDNE